MPATDTKDSYRSIHQCIEDNAAARGDSVYIHAIDQGKTITWSELRDVCNRIAHFLKSRNIGANDRVVVFSENTLEAMILFIAAWRYGVTVSTINIEMNHQHLDYILSATGPKLVLYDEAMDPDALTKVQTGEWVPFGEWFGDKEDQDSVPGAFFRDLESGDLDILPPAGDRDAFSTIMFTSGTTDRPKGVVQQYESYFRVGEAAVDRWNITAADTILDYRSLAWGSPQMLTLLPSLNTGAAIAIALKFSHSRFFDWVRTYRPTMIVGVPTVINMLLNRESGGASPDFSSVRFMTSSSAPLSPEQQQMFEDTYGITLVCAYGMSEGGVLAANPVEGRKIGSVGPAGRYQDLSVLDSEGNGLPQGATGEIRIGGAQRAFGYIQPDGSVEPLAGRHIKTGDLGYLDEDGFLFITGRTKDLIIRGGVNITPLEVDNALLEHPDILEAATIGVPDKIYGEEVVSYLVLKPGAMLDEMAVVAHCKGRLADAKIPKTVLFEDSIPKSDRGKIDKSALVTDWKARA